MISIGKYDDTEVPARKWRLPKWVGWDKMTPYTLCLFVVAAGIICGSSPVAAVGYYGVVTLLAGYWLAVAGRGLWGFLVKARKRRLDAYKDDGLDLIEQMDDEERAAIGLPVPKRVRGQIRSPLAVPMGTVGAAREVTVTPPPDRFGTTLIEDAMASGLKPLGRGVLSPVKADLAMVQEALKLARKAMTLASTPIARLEHVLSKMEESGRDFSGDGKVDAHMEARGDEGATPITSVEELREAYSALDVDDLRKHFNAAGEAYARLFGEKSADAPLVAPPPSGDEKPQP